MMKNIFKKILMGAGVLALTFGAAACSDDEDLESGGDSGSSQVDPDGGGGESTPDQFGGRVFEVINLDYPGLERVKSLYEAGNRREAAEALLTYFRYRTERVNPAVSPFPSVSSKDMAYARAALKENKYRFLSIESVNEKENTPQSYWNDKEKKIDWRFWPKDSKGNRSNESRYQLHRHYWFNKQARAYASTGDEKFAQGWMEVYSDWMVQNPRPTEALDYSKDPSWADVDEDTKNAMFAWRPLEVAHRVQDQTELIYYFSNSKSLTAEFWAKLLVSFAEQVQHIIDFMTPEGNHRLSQGTAVFYAGMLCPEFKDAEKWLQKGTEVLNEAVVAQFHADGMHRELDLGYHMGALADFLDLLDLARVNNINPFTPEYTHQVENMVGAVMDLTYPDYTIPNMNDTRHQGTGKRSVMQRNHRRYFKTFPDMQGLEWRATQGKSGERPAHLAAAYDQSGYYVLRTGWDANSTMMILKNGPEGLGGNFHNQPDNGTFELYINGRNFFVDSGCYAYSGDQQTIAMRNWFRATRVHNTMTRGEEDPSAVTRNNIKSQNGKLIALNEHQNFGDRQFDVLVTENQGYADLKHRRTVYFAQDLIVLFDEGIGSAAAPVNVNYHFCDKKDFVTVDEARNATSTSFSDGNNISLKVFSNEALRTRKFEGRYSIDTGKSSPRWGQTSTIDKKAGERACFVTVITSGQLSGKEVEARITPDTRSAQCMVRVDGREYNLSNNLE